MMAGQEWLTRDEAASYLGVAKGTLEQWAVKGHGPPFYKISRRLVRYKQRELDLWIERHHHGIDAGVAQEQRTLLDTAKARMSQQARTSTSDPGPLPPPPTTRAAILALPPRRRRASRAPH